MDYLSLLLAEKLCFYNASALDPNDNKTLGEIGISNQSSITAINQYNVYGA